MPFIVGFLSNLIRVLFTRLAAWIWGLLAPLLGYLILKILSLFGKHWQVVLGLAAITAAVYTFSAAIDAAFYGITLFAPDEYIKIGRMLLPSNISLCVSVLVIAKIKSLIFFWIVRTIEKFERS